MSMRKMSIETSTRAKHLPALPRCLLRANQMAGKTLIAWALTGQDSGTCPAILSVGASVKLIEIGRIWC